MKLSWCRNRNPRAGRTLALAARAAAFCLLTTTASAAAAATCGNGILESPEQCDDGDVVFDAGEYCSGQCAFVPCGIPTDPNGTKPKAGDALFALRTAVGQTECDLRVCDVNHSTTVTAADALLILKAAVGLAVQLECAPGPTTTTTTTSTTTTTTTTSTSTSTTTTLGPPACGDTELCASLSNVAFDDDCDGAVEEDEACSCDPGIVQGCFEGDPSYYGSPGCHPGTQRCGDSGVWEPCTGGVHATDACFESNTLACHPLVGFPLVPVNLHDGVGDFGADAISETWTVECPQGVSPCPSVGGAGPADDFQPLQSGEYAVTYSKVTASDQQECAYPLLVGDRGLRVELQWEHDLGDSGVDLDLHLHEPGSTDPWGGVTGNAHDCAWDNCTAARCVSDMCPEWFQAVAPPDPVAWWLDPVFERNSCYFAPGSSGAEWQAHGLGCHNPRLELDNTTCDAAQSDAASANFCRPENINIDFPPVNQWTRVGVHYYSSHDQTYDVHPRAKIYCNGTLVADLGPAGYHVPEAPVVFAADGSSTLFWLVADVQFQHEGLGVACVVRPLYSDADARTPVLTTVAAVQADFGPPYPPQP